MLSAFCKYNKICQNNYSTVPLEELSAVITHCVIQPEALYKLTSEWSSLILSSLFEKRSCRHFIECQIIQSAHAQGSSVKHAGLSLKHRPDTFTQFSNASENEGISYIDWQRKYTLQDCVQYHRKITCRLHDNGLVARYMQVHSLQVCIVLGNMVTTMR